MESKLNTIEQAIEALKQGKIIIVVDDENRENEGDLYIPADKCTPETINFMATYGKGLICMPITTQKARQLEIKPMVECNDKFRTAFTVSVDAKENTTTGISAYDRYETIKTINSNKTKPNDLVKPGHMFPLIAKDGGVLERQGHTEAAIDLAKLAGFKPAGVICEIMKDNGEMARLPDLMEFKEQHNMIIISVKNLMKYRIENEKIVNREVERVPLQTKNGNFELFGYKDFQDNDYVAIVKGDLDGKKNVLTRIHSGCVTGDIFGSKRCDCGPQLESALKKIEEEGLGVVIYVPHHEGRGIGLINKLKTYKLQNEGLDTVDANTELGFCPDERNYVATAKILFDLGIESIRLMTNNPEKIKSLEEMGVNVSGRVSLKIEPNKYNRVYLDTKRDRMLHML